MVHGHSPAPIPAVVSGLDSDFPMTHTIPHSFVQGLEQMIGCNLSGFLGSDFLTQRPVRICHHQGLLQFDDRPSGDPDFILHMPRPWEVEIELEGKTLSAFIDTGSMFTFRWDVRSTGGGTTWKIPTAFGGASLHIFPSTKVSTNGQAMGRVITGHIEGVPQPPFDVMLGANFLCQFDCYFDFQNRELLLFKKPIAPNDCNGIDSDRMSCGFQFKFRTRSNALEMVVSNHTHPNVPVPVGTVFSIPGVHTDSSHTNAIFNALYPKEGHRIEIQTAKGPLEIPTQPFCFGTHNIQNLR